MNKYTYYKSKCYSWLDPSKSDTALDRAINRFFILIIILNILAVIIETIPQVGNSYATFFDNFEKISIAIFTAEYILRVWSITSAQDYGHPIKGRLKYLLSFNGWIDLISILPYYLHISKIIDLRFIRIFSLFRFLKIFRFGKLHKSFSIFRQVFFNKKEELLTCLLFTIVAIITTSSLMFIAEHEVQPEKFSSIPETIYWSVITLTTIGYGDMVPVTVYGKILTVILSLVGIAILALPTGILVAGLSQEVQKLKIIPPKICPYCHKQMDN